MLAFKTPSKVALTLFVCSVLWACKDKNALPSGGQMPPPEVLVEVISPQRIVVKSELPGRAQAFRTAEIRARVEGIIQKRLFKEGSEVDQGQVLFEIDPATLQADLDAAKASLARAEADVTQSQLKQERFARLLKKKAISQQQYDEAFALLKQAEADVAATKAAVARAQIDLNYATVQAPITGRIGRAMVTEGALVGKGEATHLSTIEQLDPIYVNFTQSSADILKFRQSSTGEKMIHKNPSVQIILEDGSTYQHGGKLLFSEMTVDPSTGAVLLRAEIPNPDRLLLPGMFLRVIVEQAEYQQALTISQRSLVRTAEGEVVMSVLPDGKVVPLPVKVERSQDDRWIVSKGLVGGEQVIVEGLQKAKPGTIVKPVTKEKE